MKTDQKKAHIPVLDSRVGKPVELVSAETVSIPPQSCSLISLKPKEGQVIEKKTYALLAANEKSMSKSVQDAQCHDVENIVVQVQNFTKKVSQIHKGELLAYGNLIYFRNLPQLDDFYACQQEGEILNNVSLNPDLLPSQKCEKAFERKMKGTHQKIAEVVRPFKSMFISENPGEDFQFMSWPDVSLPLQEDRRLSAW